MEWSEIMLENFPNAVDGHKLTRDISDFLQSNYQMTRKNTLFGFSTCGDEINRTVTDFKFHYGEKQFPLGGLTGYPFRGKTGFSAFSHHVPDNKEEGNLIVLYGPHVGINEQGELGKVRREGQSHDSTACGAAIAFLNKYIQAKNQSRGYKPEDNPLDMEQTFIEKQLLPYGERIVTSINPIKELVVVNYEIINRDITEIIKNLKTHFKGKIVLIGGIMINTPLGQQGYFDLRNFEMYHNDTATNLIKKI